MEDKMTAMVAWKSCDPAHRGAVMQRLMSLSHAMQPSAQELESGRLSDDIQEQNIRRAALSLTFDAAIWLLIEASKEG